MLMAQAAQRYMADVHKIGKWTLAPHLALHGDSPAQVLAREGREGLQRILDDMVSYTPSRPDLPVDADDRTLWEGIREILGPQAVVRVEQMLDAPELEVTEEDLADLDFFDEPDESEPHARRSDATVKMAT